MMAGGWWSCLPFTLKGGSCVVKKVIAKIRLNPGQGGYFDPITRIHLTYGSPEGEVYAGMNTEGLKAAVRNKRISLVSGSLGEFVPPFKLVKQSNGKVALVVNSQDKTVQKSSVTKQKTVNPVKQEEKIADIKVETVTEQPEQTIVSNIEIPVKQEEFPDIKVNSFTLDSVTAKDTSGISETDISDISSVVNSDDQKTTNPFKKNKKKGSAKKETTEEAKLD